jgi:hypothetical protein
MASSTMIKALDFTTENPCPAYCNLPAGHRADSLTVTDHRPLRGHGTVDFGNDVTGGCDEYLDSPGVFHADVNILWDSNYSDADQLLSMARSLSDAVAWLVEQNGAQT